MTDAMEGLPPADARRMRLLLDAVDGIDPTPDQVTALRWLAGWEDHVVRAVATLLIRARRSTADLRDLLTTAGYGEDEQLPLTLAALAGWEAHGELPAVCRHAGTAPAGRAVARLADADPAVEGLTAHTTVATCLGCAQLVAGVELRPSRSSGPGWTAAPSVLRRQGSAVRDG